MRAATQFEHAEIVIAENTAQAEGSEEFDRVVDRVGFDPHVTDRHRRPAIFCDRFLLVSGLGGATSWSWFPLLTFCTSVNARCLLIWRRCW